MQLEEKISEALRDPSCVGEMADADAVGTAGSEDCGDMLRMWVKFREEGGRKVIDKASFQSFGCQTALAVATVAAKLIRGRTAQEAASMSGEELSAPLGPLPPMKIHCAQLVETALQQALRGELPQNGAGAPSGASGAPPAAQNAPGLIEKIQATGTRRIVFRNTKP